jgi:hypothetical protein
MNAESKEDLSDYPAGAKVIVRYNPKQPQESVLYCKGTITTGTPGGGVAPEFIVLN